MRRSCSSLCFLRTKTMCLAKQPTLSRASSAYATMSMMWETLNKLAEAFSELLLLLWSESLLEPLSLLPSSNHRSLIFFPKQL